MIVTPKLAGDVDKLRITSRLNGDTMQDSNTADQIFSNAELICWASKDMTLMPGTVIMTGTPEGIGAAMSPPRFMVTKRRQPPPHPFASLFLERWDCVVAQVPGDTIECEIENLGVLRNTIVQAPVDGICPNPL